MLPISSLALWIPKWQNQTTLLGSTRRKGCRTNSGGNTKKNGVLYHQAMEAIAILLPFIPGFIYRQVRWASQISHVVTNVFLLILDIYWGWKKKDLLQFVPWILLSDWAFWIQENWKASGYTLLICILILIVLLFVTWTLLCTGYYCWRRNRS
jgi:hypothetical protein